MYLKGLNVLSDAGVDEVGWNPADPLPPVSTAPPTVLRYTSRRHSVEMFWRMSSCNGKSTYKEPTPNSLRNSSRL